MSFQITDAAAKALTEYATEELFEGEFIRIARQYQCGGSRFEIIVDDSKSSVDTEISVSATTIVVNQSCLDLLDAVKLDFTPDGFVFIDDIGNQC